ncbi:hypothetical protein [Rhizobium leguminosarum]
MKEKLDWDFSGISKIVDVPIDHPYHYARSRLLRLKAMMTDEDRVCAVGRMIASAVEHRSTSRTSPSTSQVWRELTADVSFLRMTITDFISEQAFRRRVEQECARQRLTSRRSCRSRHRTADDGPPALRDLLAMQPNIIAVPDRY